jgi:hypothetical protein
LDYLVHLALLQWRQSPTDTILECRTDMYTVFAGMRIPNADDKTWYDNKWRSTVEQLYEIHHHCLHVYFRAGLSRIAGDHTGRLAHNIAMKI